MDHKLSLPLFIAMFFSGSVAFAMNENPWKDIKKWNEVEINKIDEDDMTPLMRIIIRDSESPKNVKKALKNPHIDINIHDRHGTTALMFAAALGRESMVKILLQHPAVDINKQDIFGNSALILAVKAGNLAIVKLLLTKKNCNYNLETKGSGYSALCWADKMGHGEIESLLRQQSLFSRSFVHSPSPLKSLKHLSLHNLFERKNIDDQEEDDDHIIIKEVNDNDK